MSNLNASMTLSIRDKWSRGAKRFQKDMKGLESSSRRLRGEFKGVSNDTRKMAQASSDAARKQLKLISNFKQTQKTLASTRSEFDRAKSEVARLKEQMQAIGPPVKGLEQRLNKANATLSRTKDKFRSAAQASHAAKNGLREAGIEAKQLAATEKRLSSSLDKATQDLREQAAATRKLEGEYQRLEHRKRAIAKLTDRERNRRNDRAMLGGKIAIAGVSSMIAGRQVARPVVSSANQFGNFEEAMDSVAAVARIKQNSGDYKELFNLARELGATTSYSAIEAAQGMNFLAMAGMDKASIKAAMADVLNLAKATKTDLAATADISSNILSGFGLAPEEMNRVANVLTATTTRANVDLTMLGESMKYAAPIAKQLGVSLEETAAMAGLLGNVGIQGSMAGTSLRTIYTRLAAPNKRARSALKALKVETKDLKGNLLPVPDLLLKIAKASEGMGSGKRAEMFKDIVGAEAGSAFASLLDEQGFEVFEKLLKDLKNVKGEAARVATEMGDNWMGDKKALGSAMAEIALIFGESLNPALREATQWITKQTRAFGEWLKAHPKLTRAIAFTVAALAGLLVVGGGFLTFMGTSIALLAGLRFGLFMLGLKAKTGAGAIGLVGTALKALAPIRWAALLPVAGLASVVSSIVSIIGGIGAGLVTATAPVWGIIAALVAAVAGFALAIYNYWVPISEFVGGFADVIGDALSSMVAMSRTVKRHAASAALATSIAAAPMAATAAPSILPSLAAAEATAAGKTDRKIELNVSVPIGSITASDPNIEARVQQAIHAGVEEAVERALARLSDRLGD
ncbi:phage tail tape measure protein, TP901 family, core region [Cohaesibacter sp. ES.047]|uniref:phage tail tape measure protein n=1 Tax=Cohaesibacter sp. ES.047 TaxID=1798205 RepID=UPI000BBF5D24|nr:phage tail tape measure protein [Cohaesibacter sp. ES.047]SNY91406.1 phage tail tape measure protein, TP901 family, core region [Cohaesibacter sp. ES.047]